MPIRPFHVPDFERVRNRWDCDNPKWLDIPLSEKDVFEDMYQKDPANPNLFRRHAGNIGWPRRREEGVGKARRKNPNQRRFRREIICFNCLQAWKQDRFQRITHYVTASSRGDWNGNLNMILKHHHFQDGEIDGWCDGTNIIHRELKPILRLDVPNRNIYWCLKLPRTERLTQFDFRRGFETHFEVNLKGNADSWQTCESYWMCEEPPCNNESFLHEHNDNYDSQTIMEIKPELNFNNVNWFISRTSGSFYDYHLLKTDTIGDEISLPNNSRGLLVWVPGIADNLEEIKSRIRYLPHGWEKTLRMNDDYPNIAGKFIIITPDEGDSNPDNCELWKAVERISERRIPRIKHMGVQIRIYANGREINDGEIIEIPRSGGKIMLEAICGGLGNATFQSTLTKYEMGSTKITHIPEEIVETTFSSWNVEFADEGEVQYRIKLVGSNNRYSEIEIAFNVQGGERSQLCGGNRQNWFSIERNDDNDADLANAALMRILDSYGINDWEYENIWGNYGIRPVLWDLIRTIVNEREGFSNMDGEIFDDDEGTEFFLSGVSRRVGKIWNLVQIALGLSHEQMISWLPDIVRDPSEVIKNRLRRLGVYYAVPPTETGHQGHSHYSVLDDVLIQCSLPESDECILYTAKPLADVNREYDIVRIDEYGAIIVHPGEHEISNKLPGTHHIAPTPTDFLSTLVETALDTLPEDELHQQPGEGGPEPYHWGVENREIQQLRLINDYWWLKRSVEQAQVDRHGWNNNAQTCAIIDAPNIDSFLRLWLYTETNNENVRLSCYLSIDSQSEPNSPRKYVLLTYYDSMVSDGRKGIPRWLDNQETFPLPFLTHYDSNYIFRETMRAFAVITCGTKENENDFLYNERLPWNYALPQELRMSTFFSLHSIWGRNDPLGFPLRDIINEPACLEKLAKMALQSCWWLTGGD